MFAVVLVSTVLPGGLAATGAAPAAAQEAWPWPNHRVSNDQWLAHSEPSVAQDPTNPDILVGASKMFSTLQGGPNGYKFKIGTYYSHDGGMTWVDQGMLGGNDPNNSWTALGYGNTTDPAVTFDSAGNVYVEIMVYQGTGENAGGSGAGGENNLVVYKSTDNGVTWGAPMEVAHMPPGPSVVMDLDKNWITADTTGGKFDGFLYSTWTYLNCVITCHNVYFAASYDGGQHWTPPKILSLTGSPLNQTSTPVVGPDGTVYVVFHDYSGHRLFLTKSSDAGATFSVPAQIASINPPPTLNGNVRSGPLVIGAPAVLPNGKIIVAWNDSSGDDVDIFYKTSTDGGATWSSESTLNQGTAGDQFQPWVTATRAGTLWAMWFDRRDDPANMMIHVYAARSTDGGATWTEYRVTDVASDPRVGLPLDRGNRGFYGDYQGLVADDQTGANILWNETRPGSQELYFARVNPDQSTVAATASGGTVQISGHAAFRAPSAAGAAFLGEDAAGDVPTNETGIDLLGAKLYQPDPYAPWLAFEWRAAKLLPPRGAAPEVTRYMWYFGVGTGDSPTVFQLVAKISNVASTGAPNDPVGFAGHAGASFQLRGNCGATPVGVVTLNDCQHLAWVPGHFDVTRGVVRMLVPVGSASAPAIAPGAVVRTALPAQAFEIQASHALVASTNDTADLVDWPDETTYTIGDGKAFVGVAPAGTDPAAVSYSAVTLEAGGSFTTTRSGAAGQSAYLKTCFDGRCDITVASVA
jgi:hypothetical protein